MSIALHDASQVYAERFGEAPPATLQVPPDKYPDLIAAIQGAVERGRKLSEAEVRRIAGLKSPGPDQDPDRPLVV